MESYKSIYLIIINLVVILLFTKVSAQTDQGNFMIGISGSGYYDESRGHYKELELSLSPDIGYFVSNNFMLGTGLCYSYFYTRSNYSFSGYDGKKKNYTNTFSIFPIARYYVKIKKFSPFLHAYLGGTWGNSKEKSFEGEVLNREKLKGFVYGGGIGFTYFISKKVGVEVLFLYNYKEYKKKEEGESSFDSKEYGEFIKRHNFSMNLGINIYLPTNKKSKDNNNL
ncbi:MAG: hypothetical protein K8R37_12850 [Bacteroidales bacterium]|nr:hypothetical protein [Bacteroidales bacterium]